MSITHSLKLGSSLAPDSVLNLLLSSGVGLKAATYDEMKTEGNGLFGRIADLDNHGRKYLHNKFNVQANISVVFDEDMDGDTEEGRQVLGDAVALLLKREDGDAMFFYIFDTPILKRTNSIIEVIDEPEFDWLRNALDEAGLTYQLKSEQEIRSV